MSAGSYAIVFKRVISSISDKVNELKSRTDVGKDFQMILDTLNEKIEELSVYVTDFEELYNAERDFITAKIQKLDAAIKEFEEVSKAKELSYTISARDLESEIKELKAANSELRKKIDEQEVGLNALRKEMKEIREVELHGLRKEIKDLKGVEEWSKEETILGDVVYQAQKLMSILLFDSPGGSVSFKELSGYLKGYAELPKNMDREQFETKLLSLGLDIKTCKKIQCASDAIKEKRFSRAHPASYEYEQISWKELRWLGEKNNVPSGYTDLINLLEQKIPEGDLFKASSTWELKKNI